MQGRVGAYNHTALLHEALGLGEISEVVRLVCIDEDEVKRRSGLQRLDRLGSRSDYDLRLGGETSMLKIGAGDLQITSITWA